MRYQEDTALEPIYSQSAGLHFMLNFTVVLALIIGVVLLWLGLKGRVMWLTVWSAGLIIASILYLGAATMGLTNPNVG